ncbi:PepSY-associated TM helix domain-containing protein [Mangrovimonas xylaniphaga]|uniref:PepSY-associated TM helix domain-containing protein n=1 Tax=Mangrovimonas xylaniphaga TaxID=1645915 RepID=UPI0009E73802|nr:PepSY-associated TM helix domain-containing protein [Mangrovimonas xylaniphaga]
MNNRRLLKYHSYLGLISGLFLLVIGLTGAILAFNEDIDDITFRAYRAEVSSESTLNLDQAIHTVQGQFPEWETRIVHFQPGESILFNLRLPDARRFVFVHPESGTIIANIDANTTVAKWILKLHYSFHAGVYGRILVFVVGVLFFLSLITGLILYRKVLVKTLLFKVKIKRSHSRNFYSALHRYVGVWALLFNLVLVITGTVLAFKVSRSALQTPKLPEPPQVTISIEESLKTITDNYPDFTPSYLRFPKTKEAPITVNGTFDSDPFYYSKYFNKILIDSNTGAISSVTKVSEASLLTRLDSMVSPLHFGQYGGMFIKLLYCFIGLSGPFLSVTGFIIWKQKRKKSKK